jgi:hypothetical protein
MSICLGITSKGKQCTRGTKLGEVYCWQHNSKLREDQSSNNQLIKDQLNKDQTNKDQINKEKKVRNTISGNRQIGNISLFDGEKRHNSELWEQEYTKIMEKKYAKNTRNFSKINGFANWLNSSNLTNSSNIQEIIPKIYLIPRVRAGPSYKNIEIIGSNKNDMIYAAISKGYPMQDVSSFTMGPIVGEGLCLVNAAFSKAITIHHIEGGGLFDTKRKNFWKPANHPIRKIQIINDNDMFVDDQIFNIHNWLVINEDLWLNEWLKWSRSIAMSSRGDFHWADDSPTLAYRYGELYLNFLEWKKQCYIKPSFDLLPNIEVFKYLKFIVFELKLPLGLVHPKALNDKPELPITKEYLKELFNSPFEMCCQPYVIAGKLLKVDV